MTKQIEIIKKTRSFLLENLKDLTIEQLNKVPEGFNNNIIWNLGHMIAAQQGVCYIRAGLTPKLSEDFINAYKSGSKPAGPVDAKEIENIKTLLFSTLDQLEADYNNHIFEGYTGWTTRYGVELANIDEAISFIPFHEGLHSGCVTALKRLVIK
ncbi:DinB family protein [Mucilaginibacter sp. McL0603]|uniref:DinB family protein n=1 Tax=Mucilaginibacter sp. McL0603 TaxID=3415670 RepID=UPI003CE9C223